MIIRPWDKIEWLGEDRLLLFESTQNMIERTWDFEQLADVEARPNGWSKSSWQALGTAGMIGLEGLAEGSYLDAALVALACGRGLMVVPIVETAATLALLDLSDAVEAVQVAELIRAGVAVGVVVDGQATPDGSSTSVCDPVVPFGGVATSILVRDRGSLFLAEQQSGSLSEAASSIGPIPFARVEFADVNTIPLNVPDLDVAWKQSLAVSALTRSAVAVGGCIGAIDTAIEYVNQRHQFGVPVGSFQAVQHRLADAAIATELARTALLSAAHTTPGDLDAGHVWRAQRLSLAAYLDVGRAVCQVRGGYGFSVEFDGQAHFRMAKTQAVLAGDVDPPNDDPLSQVVSDAGLVSV